MKAVVTDYIEDNLDWEAGELRKAGIGFGAFQLKFKPEAEVASQCAGAEVVVVNMVKMHDAQLALLKDCRLLIRHGIGYDNVDVAACTRHGIQFAYQPDYCKEDVAEHAVALIFACGRKVVWSRATLDQASATGQWDFSKLFPIYRLDGKTLGILGLGRIGSRVFRKLKSFGFRILGSDPYLSDKRKAEMEGIQWVDTDTLFKESDFLTVHTPLNNETKQIVNARTLSLMKPTAYLVNTARGGMVDEVALGQVLRERRIAGAAIDVFTVEPPPPTHPLFGLDNIILTPHIGWASEEAGWEIRKSILDDIVSWSKGGNARCVINKETLRK
ncbi:MAG: hypothetical protein A2269_02625 [Lentisphaerae bacterium RIFOXYA12_FULL_60_10]|nr:MAG: hypothetical protein A2269_02625 [Lentisphaerae bacterium RIFOXYA12_FULL_60_10]